MEYEGLNRARLWGGGKERVLEDEIAGKEREGEERVKGLRGLAQILVRIITGLLGLGLEPED